MASEDGSVKIKVDMDISDVTAGVKDIGGQLKRVGTAAGKASETLRSALANAVDKTTGKSMQGQIYSLGSKLAALGPTFQKAMQGNSAAAATFQAKAADIAESISRLWNGLRQLGEVQYASPELDAMNGEIAETDRRVQELAEKVHSMREAGSTVKNDAQFKQLGQEFLQEIKRLDELKAKREELIKSGKGVVSFKNSADFQGMAASLDAVNGRLTGMLERLVEAAMNAAATRRELEKAAAAVPAVEAATSAPAVETAAGDPHLEEGEEEVEKQATAWERFRQKLIGVAASMGLVRSQTDGTSTAMTTLRTSAGAAASGMNGMFKKVLKWGLGIRSTFILVRRLRSAVKEGLTTMAQHDTETANTLNGLKTALTNVKLSLATAFAPIVTAAAPLLIKLSSLVAKASNYVARFFAMLTGQSTYKKAVAAQDAITDSVAGTGAAAKDAAKNLAGLDELNIWQENKDGSGGGGGGGSGTDVDMEEVPTGEATDFVVRLRDILFQWDDLDPELIAEKILTGLCAAAGGIIGWTIGGPLGGLVGLTLGALLGVRLSQVIFDGDGNLSKDEIKNLILAAVGTLVSGVLGFSILGHGGAAGAAEGAEIGFSIKTGIVMAIAGLAMEYAGAYDMAYSGPDLKSIVKTAIGSALGVAGSLLVFGTGPVGWIVSLGLALSVGLMATIQADMDKTQQRFEQTPLYQKTQEWISAAQKSIEITKDVKVKLSATVEDYETAGSELQGVKDMIDRLFDLDSVEVKTNGQLEEMKTLIDYINGLDIEGLHIDLDPDGKIVQTKEDLKAITEELIKQAKAQAAKEGIVEAYKQQAIAASELKTQQELLTESEKDLAEAQKRNSEAVKALDDAQQMAIESGGDYSYVTKELSQEHQNAAKALSEAQAAHDKLKESVDSAKSAYDEAGNKIKFFSGLVAEVGDASDTAREGLEELDATDVNVNVNATAEVTEVKDDLSPEQKVLGVTAEGREFKNGLRTNPTMSAILRGERYESGFATPPTQGVRAKATNYDRMDTTPTQDVRARGISFTNGLSEKPVVNTVAKGVSWINGVGSPVINTVSNFASVIMGLSDAQRTIKTWSQYEAVKNNLTDKERTIKTWSQYEAVKNNLTDKERTIKIWAQYNAVKNALSDKQKTISVKAKISEIVGSVASKVKSWLGLATGGIYKNGKWEPIAGYASGGNPRSARLFYANENGMPELVGRIGSSTAVMNNGQIVASVAAGVYRAVAAAMGQVGGWFRSMSAQLANIPPAIEMLSAMPAQTPQPVLAAGTVLPPKAVYASVEAAELTAAVRELRDALNGASLGGEQPIVVNVQLDGQVDGKALFRAVATEARIQRRASGKDPFAG